MKKTICVLLALVMAMSFVACSNAKTESGLHEKAADALVTSTPKAKTDKYYELKNVGTGKNMNVEKSKSTNNANIYMYQKDGTTAQQFKFKYNSKYKGYTMTPKCATSRMVNVYGTKAKNKSNVCSYTASSSATQTWVLKKVSGGYVLCCADNKNLVLTATGKANKSNVDIETYKSGNKNQIWTSSALYVQQTVAGATTTTKKATTTTKKSGFTARTSAPAMSGYYANYWSNNCTRYVCCRVNEILGKNFFNVQYRVSSPAGTDTGSNSIYTKLKNAGYATGSQPKKGAVMVSSSHVAVVESVSGNKIVWSNGNSYTKMSNGGIYSNVVVSRNRADGGNTASESGGTWFYITSTTYNTSTGNPNNFPGTWVGYVYLV